MTYKNLPATVTVSLVLSGVQVVASIIFAMVDHHVVGQVSIWAALLPLAIFVAALLANTTITVCRMLIARRAKPRYWIMYIFFLIAIATGAAVWMTLPSGLVVCGCGG